MYACITRSVRINYYSIFHGDDKGAAPPIVAGLRPEFSINPVKNVNLRSDECRSLYVYVYTCTIIILASQLGRTPNLPLRAPGTPLRVRQDSHARCRCSE